MAQECPENSYSKSFTTERWPKSNRLFEGRGNWMATNDLPLIKDKKSNQEI
jgi:hypothetical protein